MVTNIRLVAVVVSSFLVNLMSWGMTLSMGVMYIELLEQFDATKSATAWVSSIFTGVILIAGAFVGSAVEKFGCRRTSMFGSAVLAFGLVTSVFATSLPVLYVTFGIIGGIGASFMHTAAIVVVLETFTKRRALMSCMSGAGSSVGSLVIPLITQALLDTYAFRGTLLLLAGLALQCVACSALFVDRTRLSENSAESSPDGKHECDVTRQDLLVHSEQVNDNKMSADVECFELNAPSSADDVGQTTVVVRRENRGLKGRVSQWVGSYRFVSFGYLLFAFQQGIFNMGMTVPYLLLADVSWSRGTTKQEAAVLQSFLGIGSVVCRLLFGFLGDIKHFDTLYLNIISLAMFGTLIIAVNFVYSYSALLVVTAMMGFLGGFPAGMNAVIMVQLVGVENISKAVGLMFFIAFIPAFAGPPIAGWMTDVTGQFDNAFYYGGCLLYLASTLCTVVLIWKKRTFRKDSPSP